MLVRARMNLGYELILDDAVNEYNHSARTADWDSDLIRRVISMVPEGAVILDIGANIGLYALALGANLRRRGARILAFEPVAANYRLLVENIALNKLQPIIEPHRIALGERNGELLMHVLPEGEVNNAIGDNMLAPHDRVHVAEHAWKSETCPLRRLDDWFAERPIDRCDLIKIDVEGAEAKIFAHGQHFLRRFQPMILAEFNPYWLQSSGQSFAAIRAFFQALGYRMFKDAGGKFAPIDDPGANEVEGMPNYLLVTEKDLGRVERMGR